MVCVHHYFGNNFTAVTKVNNVKHNYFLLGGGGKQKTLNQIQVSTTTVLYSWHTFSDIVRAEQFILSSCLLHVEHCTGDLVQSTPGFGGEERGYIPHNIQSIHIYYFHFIIITKFINMNLHCRQYTLRIYTTGTIQFLTYGSSLLNRSCLCNTTYSSLLALFVISLQHVGY